MKILYVMVSSNIIGLIVPCYDDVKNAIKFVLIRFFFFTRDLSVTQVVEIGIYTDHLLRECEKKGKYEQCPRCSEAIGKDYDVHIKLKECNETKPNTNRCPLCHMNVPDGDKHWREHLMGVDGCVKNPRRIQALKKSKLNLNRSFLCSHLFVRSNR